jgi:transposase
MQVKTILNRVEKYKSFVYGEVKLLDDEGGLRLEVQVEARANGRALCSGCERPAPGYDRLRERRFEFVPLWGIAVYFVYALRRVACERCGVKVERVPWASGKGQLTTTYQWFLARWAKRLSWSEVAESFQTSWDKVAHSVAMAVAWGLAHRDLTGVKAIGVDEIQWRLGHKYLTVVYQIDEGAKRLLWVGKDRTIETLAEFFESFGVERSAQLQFVCSDMWRPYLKVIAERASQAVHVLDRFHIMAKLNKAIDEVRAAEARQLQQEGEEPLLKHSRWCLLKRPSNLSDQQMSRLAELVKYNLKAVRSFLLREDFQRFWEYRSPYYAGKFLDQWCTTVMRSRLEPMKKVARTLRQHRPLILNWFVAKGTISAGKVEGLNNKVKLTMRKSYGFRTLDTITLALYHSLGALPEPEFTHRFF